MLGGEVKKREEERDERCDASTISSFLLSSRKTRTTRPRDLQRPVIFMHSQNPPRQRSENLFLFLLVFFHLLQFVETSKLDLVFPPSLAFLLSNCCMLRSLFRSTTLTQPSFIPATFTFRTMSTSVAQPAEKKQRLDGPKVSSRPLPSLLPFRFVI